MDRWWWLPRDESRRRRRQRPAAIVAPVAAHAAPLNDNGPADLLIKQIRTAATTPAAALSFNSAGGNALLLVFTPRTRPVGALLWSSIRHRRMRAGISFAFTVSKPNKVRDVLFL
ncbi:hypothetical protein BS78_01G103200 [Paspalum vaginatum]|nr:hypothetical protein BS78_01G103200 [Paspalum vaginatum]